MAPQRTERPASEHHEIDARKLIAEIAERHGVLLEEGDPLFVALEAHAFVLQKVAARLSKQVMESATALPAKDSPLDAAVKESIEPLRALLRQELGKDIEGASLKARALVDAVHRSQSRRAMWMWIAIGVVAGALLFVGGFVVGRAW